MSPVPLATGFTLADRSAEIARRRQERLQIDRRAKALLGSTEPSAMDEAGGPFARTCRRLARALFGEVRPSARADAAVPEMARARVATEGEARASKGLGRALSRVTGRAVPSSAPEARLQGVALTLQHRLETLQERSNEQRREAARLGKAGNRSSAIRVLRKAKLFERQAQSTQEAVDAVEQQIDMLENAAVQKQLSDALTATSKSIKKDAKVLAKAESAIDDAAEARDVAHDLNAVMSEFARSGQAETDEDELLAELDELVASATKERASLSEAQKMKEIEMLERKIAKAEALASLPTVPETTVGREKTRKREERAELLSSSAN